MSCPDRIDLEKRHVQEPTPDATKTGDQVRPPAEKDAKAEGPGAAAEEKVNDSVYSLPSVGEHANELRPPNGHFPMAAAEASDRGSGGHQTLPWPLSSWL